MIVSEYDDCNLNFEESDIPKKVKWINNPENKSTALGGCRRGNHKGFKKKKKVLGVDCVIEYNGQPVGLIGLLSIKMLILLRILYYHRRNCCYGKGQQT